MATPNKIPEPSPGLDDTRRSLTYVGIHSNSDISWETVPSRRGSERPIILHHHKDMNSVLSGVGSQNVSVVQHVPPTALRPQIETPFISNEATNSNSLVSSSSEYTRDVNEVPLGDVNYREDIDMDDKQLLLISTKELNRVLKKKSVSKARQREIKSERRTLKNRGYASNCRVSRDEEEQQLQKDIFKLEEEIKSHPPEEYLKAENQELKTEIKNLKEELGISDDSNDSDNSKIEDSEDSKEGIKIEIKDESFDDDSDASSDDGAD